MSIHFIGTWDFLFFLQESLQAHKSPNCRESEGILVFCWGGVLIYFYGGGDFSDFFLGNIKKMLPQPRFGKPIFRPPGPIAYGQPASVT